MLIKIWLPLLKAAGIVKRFSKDKRILTIKENINPENDKFANIASCGIGGRPWLLQENSPLPFEKKICTLEEGKYTPIKTIEKISTREELYSELEQARQKYSPFLADLAPPLELFRRRTCLNDFLLDGKPVRLPHYGPPAGKAKQIYETFFICDKPDESETVHICLDSADYIAFVYVNGVCAGRHEGFFSPFEFDISEIIVSGKNNLRIELFNDYIYMGNGNPGEEQFEGDKLYAATGPGWDDPADGWHHCPPGMGLGKVYLEIRNNIHMADLFIRPLEKGIEVWAEVQSARYKPVNIELQINVYGQNFKDHAVRNFPYKPETSRYIGLGDSFTEAKLGDNAGKGIPLPLMHGRNIYKFFVPMENSRKWDLETPWLYQAQAGIIAGGKLIDTAKQQFGMRYFSQDIDSVPKGMFSLNGHRIRLRGANTMGFEQQDVLRDNPDQLISDILLTKLCNMNFWRLTQRPVQKEVYEYCDKLGLMTQTDLPLFGCMRRTKFAEGIRQAEEMERLVRSHPCNILDTYINEPFPNANNEPHRHLTRDELANFFRACDSAVRLNNPERVIKHIDGDYDPPDETLPDNHCYTMWYNGHGIDAGKLHKGFWQPAAPGWYYGCGEYGAEGLDFPDLMRRLYPGHWLDEPFHPNNICGAQTGNFHYFFFDTQDTIEGWVHESQAHQAFATRFMTEAFRRDRRMVSNAIHLFIDAWPAGWMKTIMDCERRPKPAYFAYRNALEPVMISLRTDRFTCYEGETVSIEAYLCNDTDTEIHGALVFELYNENGSLLKRGECAATGQPCDSACVCIAEFSTAEILSGKSDGRGNFTLKAVLLNEDGIAIAHNQIELGIFKDAEIPSKDDKTVLIEKLKPGEYMIAGVKVKVKACGMLPVHFASRKTGHPAVNDFSEKDFSYWYDKNEDRITPICSATFEAEGFVPILTSGNVNSEGKWQTALIAAEKYFEGKRYIICQVDLRTENPVAKLFLRNLYRT